jgi:hypothetical protein
MMMAIGAEKQRQKETKIWIRHRTEQRITARSFCVSRWVFSFLSAVADRFGVAARRNRRDKVSCIVLGQGEDASAASRRTAPAPGQIFGQDSAVRMPNNATRE